MATTILCVCPHEDCTEDPFEAYASAGDQTTVCPQCGRQQAIHPFDAFGHLLLVCQRMWKDRNAEPKDQSAQRRLYNAWRDLGPAIHWAEVARRK
jgi:hypothetical protein